MPYILNRSGSMHDLHATRHHIHIIQVLQNRILRTALDAPWYVRNTTIHKDIQLPPSQKHCTIHTHDTIQHLQITPIHLFVIVLKTCHLQDTLDASIENATLTTSHCIIHSRETVIGQHLPRT
jgi:hypothetical protein